MSTFLQPIEQKPLLMSLWGIFSTHRETTKTITRTKTTATTATTATTLECRACTCWGAGTRHQVAHYALLGRHVAGMFFLRVSSHPGYGPWPMAILFSRIWTACHERTGVLMYFVTSRSHCKLRWLFPTSQSQADCSISWDLGNWCWVFPYL